MDLQFAKTSFPVDSYKVISAFFIIDIDMLPGHSSPKFHVFGKDEILVLTKLFFPRCYWLCAEWMGGFQIS